MSRPRMVAVFALVALLGAAATAQAQSARGTVKVRPRFFNPFRPAVSSTLTINPFGVIAFAQAGPVSVAASTAAATTSAAASTTTAQASSLDSPGVSAGSGRPPFRPTPRSGYRPPPSGPLGP
jgi:hypothetical protein